MRRLKVNAKDFDDDSDDGMEGGSLSKLDTKRLPQQLLDLTMSADKKWHEKWRRGQDLLQFPHPFRACLSGPPNSGKSTAILNILARAKPAYKSVHVIYPGGSGGTSEYDMIRPKKLVHFHDHIPDIEVFPTIKDGAVKTAIIIDDLELKEIGAEERASLDRIIGHVSTHRHADVFVCSQQWTNVPPIARRSCNVFVLWRPRDGRTISMISEGVGEDLASLFKLCKSPRDSIWIDRTDNSPAPVRLNGYQVIQKKTQD
jgi:DNA polymerase III delta prime subunit